MNEKSFLEPAEAQGILYVSCYGEIVQKISRKSVISYMIHFEFGGVTPHTFS